MIDVENAACSRRYRYANLTVFFLLGCQSHTDRLLTLQEGLASGQFKVRETGTIGHVVVENTSSRGVLLQSGDIIKGGKQDRVIRHDQVIEPHSGPITVSVYCVEAGRWNKRADEDEAGFTEATDRVTSRTARLAIKRKNNQFEVWNEVSTTQTRLSQTLQHRVTSPVSTTSLQLTLEHDQVRNSISPYIDSLASKVARYANPLGVVFAINGQFTGIEVYASHELFLKVWPRLLKAAAIEAVAEFEADHNQVAPTTDDCVEFVLSINTDSQMRYQTQETGQVQVMEWETPTGSFFETKSISTQEWIHRSFVAK